MAKKFFTCLSLLIVFTLAIFGTAAAKSKAEITDIQVYDFNDETLRIEISLDGNLNDSEISTRTFGSLLTISMQNTTPGKIKKISGAEIDAEKFIERIVAKETRPNFTKVRFSFVAPINEDAYTISVQPANRAEKKSARLIIDISKKAFPLNSQIQIETKTEVKTNPETKSNDKKNNPPKKEETFTAADKVIVIDAGHGGSDAGAVGPNGVKEKDVSLAVALKTEKILKKQGMKVVMTRRTDIDVASPNASNSAELQARLDKAPPQADIFISIHCNAFTNPNSHGMETYYNGANNGGQRLAQLLNEELAKHGKLFNRGVKAANFYVIKRANCPASLIELGFITNPAEEELLADDRYQNILAGAIANAVNRFFMN